MSTTSKWRRWGRAARYVAYCAALLGALLVVAVLYLPEILDSPRVRAEIQRILSEAVRGEVAWEELSFRVLPAPHAALRNARLEIPRIASVRAEEASARLRLLPLLHGRVEITSVTVKRPAIRISVVPGPAVAEKTKEKDPATDFFGLYRAVIGPVVGAVREFAPDTLVTIEDGELEVNIPDTPPMQLRKLWLQMRSGAADMGLNVTAASDYWSEFALSARVEYADLSATTNLRGTNIRPQAWLERYAKGLPVGASLAAVRLRIDARTDAKTSLQCEVEARTDAVNIVRGGERVDIPDVRLKGSAKVGVTETVVGVEEVRLGGSRFGPGEFRFSMKDGAVSGHSGYDLDLAQAMDYTRRLVPASAREVLASLQPVSGRAQGRVKLAVGRPRWSVAVDVSESDAEIQVRDLPGPVRLGSGSVEIDSNRVSLDRVALSMPAGKVSLASLQYWFKDGTATGEGSFELDVARSLELARRALPEKNREALADIETAAGRVEGSSKIAIGRGDWKIGVNVLKSDATLDLRQLPGPVKIAGGSVDAAPAAVTIDRAAVSLLDASAVASVTVDQFDSGPRIRGAVAESTLGENLLAWVWKRAELPQRYEPAAPIRAAVSRITWHPKQGLELQANAQFTAGPSVAVDLGWAAGALDMRRMTIRDGRSDAALALRVKGRALEGRYSGALHSTSILSMLKRRDTLSGNVAGDLRFTIDREHPERMTAEGHLKGEALDLAPWIGQPLRIERVDLASKDDALQVREATVDWSGQRATLQGKLTRGAGGPVIDAQLDSPGIDMDVLLPLDERAAENAPPKPAAGGKDAALRIWPLPVTGRIAMRADSIKRGRFKVAPVVATLTLKERRAHLELEQVRLCGISLPQAIEMTPEGISASARISAQKQQLEQTAECLSGEGVLITGLFDVNAEFSTRGTLAELRQNLKGTVRAEMRDGKVMKFALLGNILSMTNVASLMKADGPRLGAEGFPYRKLIIAGHFEKGRFILEEGSFQSDAVGLAANGWISVTDYSSRLTVLVAPFSRLDQLVRKVPLVGYIVGGVFTSVPVGVSGDIRNPLVVPLGPQAVGSEILGIFERTLKLPAKLVTPSEAK